MVDTPSAPPVVAVVVTRDPGPYFDETVASLADQTYPALSILFVDAASTVDPRPRIAARLPDAFVHRLEDNPGYGAAANEVLEVVDGAPLFLFLHDDVALAPDTVEVLVTEAIRSNAAVVGPKVVEWDDPRRLRSVGLAVDKVGVPFDLVERGELDHQQHDGVRDVFAVEGGAIMIRADLFAEIGGFDPAITFLGDDVDLCWRAHVAGGRVMVAPDAVVRHVQALVERRPHDDRRHLQARHRLRTMLIAYARPSRWVAVPQAAGVAIVEVLFSVLLGRWAHAGDVVGAWRWNFRNRRSMRSRRRQIQGIRRVPDHEIRQLFVAGSARVTAFMRGHIGVEERARVLSAGGRDALARLSGRGTKVRLALIVVMAAVIAVGSRRLITDGLAPAGSLMAIPEVGDSLRAYLSSWREVGLGAETASPPGHLLLAVGRILALGFEGAARLLLTAGWLPLGWWGAARLGRRLGSPAATVTTALAYMAMPVGYNALAAGNWGGLVAFGLAPYMAAAILDVGPALDEVGRASRQRLAATAVGVGLALALGMAIDAGVVMVAAVVAAAGAASWIVGGSKRARIGPLLGAGAIATAIVVSFPWALEAWGPGADYSSILGGDPVPGRTTDLADLMRMLTGPVGFELAGWAWPAAALAPLAIAKDRRLRVARTAWTLALLALAAAWAAEQGWSPIGLPSEHILLAPYAVGLAMALGIGAVTIESDLFGHRLGWRHLVALAGTAAIVVAAVPWVSAASSGRWRTPDTTQVDLLAWMDDETDPFRTVWIGVPDDLPVGSWPLEDGVGYGVAVDGLPDASARWTTRADGATGLLGDVLELTADRRTAQAGRLLGPMGVRYLIVVRSTEPALATEPPPLPGRIADGLADQVDLRRVPSDPAVTVYENVAWIPRRASIDAETAAALSGPSVASVLSAAVGTSRPALEGGSTLRPAGRVPDGAAVLVASDHSDRWRLEIDGQRVSPTRSSGWSMTFDRPADGATTAKLVYSTPLTHLVGVALQLALVFGALLFWRRNRRMP